MTRDVKSDIPSAMILDNDSFIGQVIEKKYTIKSFVGNGAYGKVFTVLDQSDNKM